MLTVQILTKNNALTIQRTLESLTPLEAEILVADLGSIDDTCHICESFGATVLPMTGRRNEIRDHLSQLSSHDYQLLIEPWEAMVQGHRAIRNLQESAYNIVVLQNGTLLTKEPRLWKKGIQFVNPVYEKLNYSATHDLGVVLYSNGRQDADELLPRIEEWKRSSPLAAAPYYYQACTLLSMGKYEEFLGASEYYMRQRETGTVSSIMNRYYYAMVQLLHRRAARPAFQNLAICMAAKPLMAEFWCLTADLHYHLLYRFDKAKALYENAMILGRHRSKNDLWPMDIPKYKDYPQKMIASCNSILESTGDYRRL